MNELTPYQAPNTPFRVNPVDFRSAMCITLPPGDAVFDAFSENRHEPMGRFEARSGVLGRMKPYDQFMARTAYDREFVLRHTHRLNGEARTAAEDVFNKVCTNQRAINAAVENFVQSTGGFDTTFSDLFRMFFYGKESAPVPESTPSGNLVAALRDADWFDAMARVTKGDPIASAQAAMDALENLSKNDSSGDGDGQGGAAYNAAKQAAQDRGPGEEGEGQDGEGQEGQGQGQEGEGQDGEGEGGGQGQDGESDAAQGNTDAPGRGACGDTSAQKKAQDQANNRAKPNVEEQRGCDELNDEMQNLAGKLAGSRAGDDQTSPENIPTVLAVAELFRGRTSFRRVDFRKLASMIGRVEGIVKRSLSDSSRMGDGEVINVTRGHNIFQAVASEMTYFVDDDMDVLVDKRIQEGGLLMKQRKGLEDTGDGPMIILLDTSGSTNDSCHVEGVSGNLLNVLQAVAFSLVKTATQYNRPVAVLPFTCGIRDDFCMFHKGMGDKSRSKYMAELLRLCSLRPTGGTSFTTSLEQLATKLKTMKLESHFEYADVIFLSDGWGDTPHNEADAKRLRSKLPVGTNVFGLFVETDSESATRAETQNTGTGFFDVCVGTCHRNLAEGTERLFQSVVKEMLDDSRFEELD